jgi:integrase
MSAPTWLSASTRFNRAGALKRTLAWLWEEHGSPNLTRTVPHLTKPRPRDQMATTGQASALIDAAREDLRLFILFCSDLAMRSGTAVKIGPEHYDTQSQTLRFTTKKDARVCLPVTREIATLIATCTDGSGDPFITQIRRRLNPARMRQQTNAWVSATRLRTEMKELRLSLGIETRITPHDLRRTTAVRLYKYTHDLRKVQSLLGHRSMQCTIWYLDHELEEVDSADLAAIKKPFIAWRKEQTDAQKVS